MAPARWFWSGRKASPSCFSGRGLSEGSVVKPAASSTSRVSIHCCPPRWLLPSGTFFPLFARPKSSTSPWMACASPLQRATSSGRGRATATLTLPRKSSLWTTYRCDCRPSRPRGERAAPRVPLPGGCRRPCAVLRGVHLKHFEMVIKRIAFQLGHF